MSPLNVLLVVYAFPPAGGVGVLRAASLARYFPAEEFASMCLPLAIHPPLASTPRFSAIFPPKLTYIAPSPSIFPSESRSASSG